MVDSTRPSDVPDSASGASSPPPAVRRKSRGCLTALGVLLLLVVVVAGGAAVALSKASKPRDLGVRCTQADVDSAYKKIGVEFPKTPPADDGARYERVYEGSKPLDVTLTESELSALMSFNHDASYWPIKSMQVDITGPDSAQASAVVSYAGRDWPVYVAGSGGISGKSIWVDFSTAEVAGITVPAQYYGVGEAFLAKVVNDRLGRIPGLDVKTLQVTDAGVHVTGTIWEKAEWRKVP
ncbi:MAG: hypothetical protein H5T75_06595 [Coriobacteriia bacterium]|nr:hypothetical protein [Coriobacteriia bacterium]